MMKFNLGIVGPKGWIGDQILLDSKRPRIFTAVAHTRVVLYQIDLKDFFLRMPAEFVKKQTYANMQKVNYFEKRLQDIALTQGKIKALDTVAHTYQQTQTSINKYFSPMANARLVTKVGDKQILKGSLVSLPLHSKFQIYLRD